MIQKARTQLTLHHATLVLNFATFSTVASLASAPLCWMWNTAALRKRALIPPFNHEAGNSMTPKSCAIIHLYHSPGESAQEWPESANSSLCSADDSGILYGPDSAVMPDSFEDRFAMGLGDHAIYPTNI